jgi:hypothetical protein
METSSPVWDQLREVHQQHAPARLPLLRMPHRRDVVGDSFVDYAEAVRGGGGQGGLDEEVLRGDFFGLVVHPLGRGNVVDAAGDAFAVHQDDVGDRFAVSVQPGG